MSSPTASAGGGVGERPGTGTAPVSGARQPGDIYVWAASRLGAGMLAVAACLFVGHPDRADVPPRGVLAVVELPVQHVSDVETSASGASTAVAGAGFWAAGRDGTPAPYPPGGPSPE